MLCTPVCDGSGYRFEVLKRKGIYLTVLLTIVVYAHPTFAQSNLVVYPDPKIEFIIGPQVRVGTDPLASFYDDAAVRRGKYWAEQFLASQIYVSSNHYDLPLCLYILYYRTGDPVFLDYARRVADKWWKGPHIRQGLPVGGGDIPGPMYTGVLGLTLYALDGHPEVFGYLDRTAREWVDIKFLSRLNAPEIYTDLREEGYAQLLAVTLARVLPDSYPQVVWDANLNVSTIQVSDGAARRARYLADVEQIAVQYFGRLQNTDGGWRWNLWVPPYTKNMEQPFMLGIYLESVVRLHQLTTNSTVKTSLASQLTRACEHLFRDTYIPTVVSGYTSIPRVTLYFWPLALNATDYQASDRHLTTSQLHAFGYAFKITGDPKYKTWGDELWDSCYRVPGDGYSALIDLLNYLKLFTMEARSASSYLALRGGGTSQPLPGATPTPTPSGTPSPTPTPTPTSSLIVKLTSPSGNTTYSLGTSPSLAASTSNGVMTGLNINANSQVIGSSTTSPYSMVWNSPAAGTYTVTASARDDKGVLVTSTAITVKISKSLKAVRNGRNSTSSIQNSLTGSNSSTASGDAIKGTNDIDALVTTLEEAYAEFSTEKTMFPLSPDIERYLFAALYLAKASSSLSQVASLSSGVVDRISKIDVYLSFCEDLMVNNAISHQTLVFANRVNARTNVSINQPDVMPVGIGGIDLVPNGQGTISPVGPIPLTSVTEVASGGVSYELGGVSVTVGGRVVRLYMVSPTSISFSVPSDLPGGLAEVIITCRDGYIMHTTASVVGLNPTIFVSSQNSAAIVNAVDFRTGSFYTGFSLFGNSTRLTILATGISSGLVNTDVTNDVWLSGKLVNNYAESVSVEARTSDNRVFTLPVEFAGPQGALRGLDQVNISLTPELTGAGAVQITVVAGGRRSNTSTITIN